MPGVVVASISTPASGVVPSLLALMPLFAFLRLAAHSRSAQGPLQPGVGLASDTRLLRCHLRTTGGPMATMGRALARPIAFAEATPPAGCQPMASPGRGTSLLPGSSVGDHGQ